MTITLRPYQTKIVNEVHTGWNNGIRNVLAVLPTGGGKSICISQIALDREQAGANQCIMAHRTELVSQMSGHIARRGIRHRIIAPTNVVRQITQEHRREFGRSFINPDARCVVAAAQTLVARSDALQQWGDTVHNWTVDECFPAGTMIQTPTGAAPIESLKNGDPVLCFDDQTGAFHVRPVTHTFKNPKPNDMMRLKWGEHHVIETTCGHPFWTADGWKPAAFLTVNDRILFNVSLHDLRQRNSGNNRNATVQFPQNRSHLLSGDSVRYEAWQKLQGKSPSGCGMLNVRITGNIEQEFSAVALEKAATCLLQYDLREPISLTKVVRNDGSDQSSVFLRTNDKPQSDEARGNTRKGFCVTEGNEPQTSCSGWQWKTATSGGANAASVARTAWVYSSVCNSHRTSLSRVSDLLQARFGTPGFENSNRGGWSIPPIFSATSARFEEGYLFNFERLESVEVYKLGDIDATDDGFVYNIEVDEFHTYIANGVVVHNCHHLTVGNAWHKAVSLFPNALGLGVTATPSRADGLGLGRHADGLMDHMILGPSMRNLIDEGSLSEYEILVPPSDFHIDDTAITGSGDYSPIKMRDASKKSHIVGDIISHYSKHAFGKRAICFATDVETSGEIAANFNAAGIPAVSVSAKTPSDVRADYIRKFREGLIWIMVNVDLFDEGFDVPACEVVIMARPTASLGKYLQQFGRALRPAPGKLYGLIIDHVSNVMRHGLPDKPRQWTLDRREKRVKSAPDPEEIPLTVCRECTRPYERFHAACPYCGHAPVAAPIARSIEQVDGDLMLLDRAALAELRERTVLESPASVAERVGFAAGPLAAKGAANAAMARHAAQDRLRNAIAQWAGVQRALDRPDQQSYRRFYLATGVDVLTALTGKRDEMDKLAEIVEGWYV